MEEMTEIKVRLSAEQLKDFFEKEEIKQRLEEILLSKEAELKKHFEVQKEFICNPNNGVATLEACNTVDYEDIFALFKEYLCKSIMNEALKNILKEGGTLEKNILGVISSGKNEIMFQNSILMAFSDAIKRLPEQDRIDGPIKEGMLYRLNRRFAA